MTAPSIPAQRVTLVIGGGPSGSAIELLDGRSAPLYGVLPWDDLLRAGDWLNASFDPVDVVELPEHSAALEQAERAGAEMLFEALTAGREQRALRERLIALRGAAESAGRAFELVVDARIPEARDLPWELLAALPAGHAMAGIEVLRLVPCPSPREPRGAAIRMEVLLWEPVPADPISSAVSRCLTLLIEELPRIRLLRLDPTLRSLPQPAGADVARVLHVVGHGRQADAGVLLEQLEGAASAGTVVRSLGALLMDVRLVVLDVCSASAETAGPLDTPASRFAAAGAPVCIGPRLELSPEAAGAFASGLYPALERGLSITEAIGEGRRLMTLRDDPHPSARWWNAACHLSDLEAASAGCLTRPSLAGWPPGGPECEEVLQRAVERATPWGFVGIEHLCLAFAAAVHLGRTSVPFRLEEHRLRGNLDHLRPRDSLPSTPLATPRLQQLGTLLSSGYRLEELAEVLLQSRPVVALLGSRRAKELHALVKIGADTVDPGPEHHVADTDVVAQRALTLEPTEAVDGRPPPEALSPADMPVGGGLVLEAVGGPDDGRLFTLRSGGDVLGRWDRSRPEETNERLYLPPLPENTRVSRRHLVYRGEAAVEAGGAVRVLSPGEDGPGRPLQPARGEVPADRTELAVGDTLLLDVMLQDGGLRLVVRAVV